MSLSLKNDLYVVTCDHCHGRMFLGETLCPKCLGDGRILVPQETQTLSQRAVRQMFWILVGGAATGFIILALLHWFHLL